MSDKKRMQVFISHASEDSTSAKRLYKRLKEDGFEPWLDEENLLPGQNWGLEIEKAMRASDVVLLCFSATAIAKSGYIQKEYKRAMQILEEKPEGAVFVIPIRLGECEMPDFIREIQWMDYPADYDKLQRVLQGKARTDLVPSQPTMKKEGKLRNPIPTKRVAGPVFNIQGDVHINGDLVAGTQSNTVDQSRVNINITSPDLFVDELKTLRNEISALKALPGVEPSAARRLDVVGGDIEDAITEACKEKPVAERIASALNNAQETMSKLGGSMTSAVNLGTALGNLALMTWRLFGG